MDKDKEQEKELDIVTAFGNEVKRRRKEAHMTQAMLAEKCDLSVRSIGNIENGTSEPKLGSVVSLCSACRINIEKFYPNKS